MIPWLFTLFVGLDAGWDKIAACAVEPSGRKRARRVFDADVEGLCALVAWLRGLVGDRLEQLAVALERPDGPVAEMLLAHGVPLFALNPKQTDRFRDRHSVAGAKDDPLDAFVLGDALRTDLPKFRRVEPDPALAVRLRELGRTREDFLVAENRWANRLRELFHGYYPQLLELAPDDLLEPFVWDLFERYPTPAAAAQADAQTVTALLRQHRLRRLTAATVLATLQGPALSLLPGVAETYAQQAQLSLPLLRAAHAQRLASERELEATLGQFEAQLAAETEAEDDPGDIALARSLRGLGPITCAALFGEGYRCLKARDLDGLRTLSGCAPVTRASGRYHQVRLRRACNHHLRRACHNWARASVTHDPLAKDHFARLRARGHQPARAYRGVADRMLSVLLAMLRNRTPYDPARRQRWQVLQA